MPRVRRAPPAETPGAPLSKKALALLANPVPIEHITPEAWELMMAGRIKLSQDCPGPSTWDIIILNAPTEAP